MIYTLLIATLLDTTPSPITISYGGNVYHAFSKEHTATLLRNSEELEHYKVYVDSVEVAVTQERSDTDGYIKDLKREVAVHKRVSELSIEQNGILMAENTRLTELVRKYAKKQSSPTPMIIGGGIGFILGFLGGKL